MKSNNFKFLAFSLVCITTVSGYSYADFIGNCGNNYLIEKEDSHYTQKITEGIVSSLLNEIFHYCRRGALSENETVDYTETIIGYVFNGMRGHSFRQPNGNLPQRIINRWDIAQQCFDFMLNRSQRYNIRLMDIVQYLRDLTVEDIQAYYSRYTQLYHVNY